ncbi:hypothetical protein [Thalassobacillus sp. CUG 92003]|uniref:hypothetical protein n=1 Tax=Thalassobacillus sp. CUG 92003 TaxID=2736641 RepID=UPI0015E66220|nr:hypothetical protein [Thalassobacillus sp. CUG 92003]
MKQFLLGVMVGLLLTACTNDEPETEKNTVVHEELQEEATRLVSTIEEANENDRTLNSEENQALANFRQKYNKGSFVPENETENYAMNDVEEAVVERVMCMGNGTGPEQNNDIYQTCQQEYEDLLTMEEVPEDF